MVDLGNLFVRDLDDRIVRWSKGCQRLYGFEPEEAKGHVSHELLQTRFPQPLEEIRRAVLEQGRWEGELVQRCRGGAEAIVASLWVLCRDDCGWPKDVLEVNNDITARRRAEAARQESEQRFRTMADAIPQLARMARADGHIFWYNQRWYEYTGTTPAEMEGWGWQKVHDPAVLPSVLERWRASLATGMPFDMEFPLRGSDGGFRTFLTRVMPLKDSAGQVVSWFGTNTDISERTRQAEELQRLNRTLRAHRDSDQALMRAADEAEYLERVCRIVVEDCGHAMVWIGFAEHDEGKTVRPIAHAGFDEGYLASLKVTWADTPRGRGPTGTAIRTGKPVACRNMLTDPAFAPWRNDAIQRGYRSSIACPLLTDGKAVGAIMIYSRQPDPFSEDEVRLLAALTDDLAYGITALRLRRTHAQAEASLEQAAEQRRLALEGADLGTWEYRFDTGDVFWDERCRTMWGLPQGDQIEYARAIERIHTDDRAGVDAAVQRALAGVDHGAYHREFRVVWPDESVHWVASHGRVYFEGSDTQCRGVRFIGVNRDITEEKRAQAAMRERNARFKLLSEVSARLLQTENPQALVEELCRRVMDHLDCDCFFNFLVDESSGRLHLNACAGIPETDAHRIEWLDYGVAVCGCVAQSGQRIVAEDIQRSADPRTSLVKSYGVQAYACHPLLAQGRVIGTLSFGTRRRPAFAADELELMRTVADQVALVMERMIAAQA